MRRSFIGALITLMMFAFVIAGCGTIPCDSQQGPCTTQDQNRSSTTATVDFSMTGETDMHIDKDQALEIARQDALIAYRDLTPYEVVIELDDGNWAIDYELKDKTSQGGGPHYVVSRTTGEILSKRYEQ